MAVKDSEDSEYRVAQNFEDSEYSNEDAFVIATTLDAYAQEFDVIEYRGIDKKPHARAQVRDEELKEIVYWVNDCAAGYELIVNGWGEEFRNGGPDSDWVHEIDIKPKPTDQ